MTPTQLKALREMRWAIEAAQKVGLYLVADATESGVLRVFTEAEHVSHAEDLRIGGVTIDLDDAVGGAASINMAPNWIDGGRS